MPITPGEFTCPIRFEMVRPPQPVVKYEDGVTHVDRVSDDPPLCGRQGTPDPR